RPARDLIVAVVVARALRAACIVRLQACLGVGAVSGQKAPVVGRRPPADDVVGAGRVLIVRQAGLIRQKGGAAAAAFPCGGALVPGVGHLERPLADEGGVGQRRGGKGGADHGGGNERHICKQLSCLLVSCGATTRTHHSTK